jgi:hypothetical protein
MTTDSEDKKWQQIIDLIEHGHRENNARFDRLEDNAAVVNRRLDTIDTRLDQHDQRFGRIELELRRMNERIREQDVAYSKAFNRLEGKIEQLTGLIQDDEVLGRRRS